MESGKRRGGYGLDIPNASLVGVFLPKSAGTREDFVSYLLIILPERHIFNIRCWGLFLRPSI